MGTLVPNSTSFSLDDRVQSFTDSQKQAFDWVSLALEGGNQIQAAIIGPAGTGKSYLLSALIQLMRSRGHVVAKLAPSGVAAHLIGGTTVHNLFSLDIECNSKLENGTTQVAILRRTDVLVIDEFSMLDFFLFRTVEGLCRKFARRHSSSRAWGGRHILLLGDPAQLPAVSRLDIFGTTLWRQFSVLILREVKRAIEPVLSSILSKVRMGICDEEVDYTLRSCMREQNWDTLDLDKTVVICSTRDECSEINNHCIKRLEGNSCEFVAIDTDHDGNPLRVADHDRIKRYRERLPDTLVLKVGARVILRRNMDIEGGWVNGTLANVIAIHENCIVICKMGKLSERYPVPRFKQRFDIPGCSYSIMRSQFPLQLAYAVTVHRVQDMTVQKAIVKLNSKFFASGQAYVALSRVRRLEDLVLWEYCSSAIHIQDFYKQLLEWCDCVDVIRPSPPTQVVPYPQRPDDISNAPLPTNTNNNNSLKPSTMSHSKPPSHKEKSRKRKQTQKPEESKPGHKESNQNPVTPPQKKAKVDVLSLRLTSPSPLFQLKTAIHVHDTLGGEAHVAIIHRLSSLPLNQIILALQAYSTTLESIVAGLNAFPMVYASTHAHLAQDVHAASHCHPLFLETYTPIVTSGDNSCGYNAISITLTGSQCFSALFRLLCAYAMIKYNTIILGAMASATDLQPHEVHQMYCTALRNTLHLEGLRAWANDRHLFALSLLLDRPIFQYNSFYRSRNENGEPTGLVLSDTRDVHHLAERFRRREEGTTYNLLYCSNSIASIVSTGDLTQLPHPPIGIFNILNYHWVALVPVTQSALSHIPIPTTRLFCG